MMGGKLVGGKMSSRRESRWWVMTTESELGAHRIWCLGRSTSEIRTMDGVDEEYPYCEMINCFEASYVRFD